MLIDIDHNRPIDQVPYRSTFDALRRRLSDAEFDGMIARINELIDESGGEIARTPAQVWSVVGGAVVTACLRGPDLAAREAEVRGVIASLKPAS